MGKGKNDAQFPDMQKCMGKKSCPISAYAEMYGRNKSLPISA
jgi:hypothetical protein